ncbi:MAG: type III-B CRISPR module RAMP protein Cmr4 [Bacteroidetes bacterium]|nr:type III-B CRISPR module RAMP protein Cmr4 [Bacteroidota bacterium]MCW5897539.1 type III-B CRISPR module RAMP protein Cmr4 [Bacteroidota bacterium]
MSTKAKLLYLHAITPVHSGTGQAAEVIDQPIARQKATGWPMIPASSLKGVLRDLVKTKDEQKANELFGDIEKAGPIVFGDQRILCLPVRSFFGTFAYVSCPCILKRLERDLTAIGVPQAFVVKNAEVVDSNDSLKILLPKDNSVLVSGSKVYLEDLDLTIDSRKEVGDIADKIAQVLFPSDGKEFTARFAIVSDEVFNFLSETATEVQARVALEDDTKVVRKGGLWYEEAVPAEAIFCGPVLVADYYTEKETILQKFNAALKSELKQPASENTQPITIQIGGNASVGRGLCRVVIA